MRVPAKWQVTTRLQALFSFNAIIMWGSFPSNMQGHVLMSSKEPTQQTLVLLELLADHSSAVLAAAASILLLSKKQTFVKFSFAFS